MAGYRQFHTQFWKDEWLIELEPLERYLFVYLFTNDLSSISGIYKLPMRVIINETGLDKLYIENALVMFQEARKIYYKDGVMWVVNMRRFHKNASPRTMTKVNNDISDIPDCDVKRAYLYYEKTGIYRTDTVSIPNTESVSVSIAQAKEEAEEEESKRPADPFDALQMAIESAGIIPAGEADILSITDLVKNGVTPDDVKAGIAWKLDNNGGKTIRYVSQLIGPAKTAMAKRLQAGLNGNGHGQEFTVGEGGRVTL